jgi:hypothetical protein
MEVKHKGADPVPEAPTRVGSGEGKTYLSVFWVRKSTRRTPLGMFRDAITSATLRKRGNIL